MSQNPYELGGKAAARKLVGNVRKWNGRKSVFLIGSLIAVLKISIAVLSVAAYLLASPPVGAAGPRWYSSFVHLAEPIVTTVFAPEEWCFNFLEPMTGDFWFVPVILSVIVASGLEVLCAWGLCKLWSAVCRIP